MKWPLHVEAPKGVFEIATIENNVNFAIFKNLLLKKQQFGKLNTWHTTSVRGGLPGLYKCRGPERRL